MNIRIDTIPLLLLFGTLSVLPTHAQSASTKPEQAFPNRPVRILVPLSPGGGMDAVSRGLALKLGDAFSQTVVVDNRPGAGSQIALEILSSSAPDGHTLMMASLTPVTHPLLYKSRFDLLRDFAPVTQVTAQGYIPPSILPYRQSPFSSLFNTCERIPGSSLTARRVSEAPSTWQASCFRWRPARA